MANQGCLTVRGDGVVCGTIRVGSRAVMFAGESWTRGEVKSITSKFGGAKEPWTRKITLAQRLVELCGDEHARRIMDVINDSETITIEDEYSY